MRKSSLSVESRLDTPAIIAFLEELTNSIRHGKVVVQHDVEFVALTPTTPMRLKLKAKVEQGRQTLRLKLSWKEDGTPIGSKSFQIGAVTPDPSLELSPVDEAFAEAESEVLIGGEPDESTLFPPPNEKKRK